MYVDLWIKESRYSTLTTGMQNTLEKEKPTIQVYGYKNGRQWAII